MKRQSKKSYPIEGRVKKRKKLFIGILSLIGILVCIYFGMSIYFMNHFYFGSTINGVNVSGESVETVNELMAAEIGKYQLTLKERDGIEEIIIPDEVGLTYEGDGEFRELKDNQNPYRWVITLFDKENLNIVEGVKLDEALLAEKMDKLSCFDGSKVIIPQSPVLQYKDGSYELIPEVNGNEVKKDILYNEMKDSLLERQAEIDLEEIDCYVKPEYTIDSEEVVDAEKLINTYVAAKITYSIGSDQEYLDGDTINKWITIDENYNVTFNEEEARSYAASLANEYTTVGKQRSFKTSGGSTINVGGGDYGWAVGITKTTEALIESIEKGETVTKKPSYYATAMVEGRNDIGNTYVEVDLTNQHLWFYKNGTLIVDGPVVTGNVSANNATPAGVYKLKYKEKNATLRGEDYETPVDYWMPFNGGIGIHDATWRSEFGETIYQTSGSHGCVNSPYSLAKTVFENITPGTPVVCYN
ncbi:L,D-transpeptidase family protein [Clostridium sp. DL1XJH146]